MMKSYEVFVENFIGQALKMPPVPVSLLFTKETISQSQAFAETNQPMRGSHLQNALADRIKTVFSKCSSQVFTQKWKTFFRIPGNCKPTTNQEDKIPCQKYFSFGRNLRKG